MFISITTFRSTQSYKSYTDYCNMICSGPADREPQRADTWGGAADPVLHPGGVVARPAATAPRSPATTDAGPA